MTTGRAEAAAARLAATHERLTAAVDALANADEWRTLLTLTSRVHRYSPNNLMLIAAQRPDATCVYGYKKWEEFGRHVRKGERGIAILAPTVSRRRDGDSGRLEGTGARVDRDDPDPAGRVISDARDASTVVVTGYRVTYVFDITQTDGPDLAPAGPQLLDGEAPLGLFSDLLDLVEAAGYSFGYQMLDKGNGRTDYTSREVLVRPDLSGAQTVKTLTHELAHVMLHDPADNPHLSLRPIEVEAESVAYIVTAAHGLPSDDYSVPYVTGWAGGDRRLLEQTADRVLSCAATILATTGPAEPVALATDGSRVREVAASQGRDLDVAEGADVIDITLVGQQRAAGGVAR